MAPISKRILNQANSRQLAWAKYVALHTKCVTWDDVPDGTNVGYGAAPAYSSDFGLNWAKTAVVTGNVADVFARKFAGASSKPNVLAITPTGDPGIDTNTAGELVIQFNKPKLYIRMLVKPLANSSLLPSVIFWNGPALGPIDGLAAYPANATGWQPIVLTAPTAKIVTVVFRDGYLDDLCYA